jgi:hypothetical protein
MDDKAANSIYYSGCMPIVAWALFLISALLEVGGDATIRMGLRDGVLSRRRLAFWIATVLVLGLIAVPWFAPLFYSL